MKRFLNTTHKIIFLLKEPSNIEMIRRSFAFILWCVIFLIVYETCNLFPFD